jgi:hypothetical protein
MHQDAEVTAISSGCVAAKKPGMATEGISAQE